MKLIRNLFLFIILIAVIIVSFWLSFNLGKNILMPVTKKMPSTADLLTMEADVMKKIGKITFEVESMTLDQAPAGRKTAVKAPAYMKPKIAESRRQMVSAAKVKTVTPAAYTCSVQSGLFASKKNAQALVQKLKVQGFNAFIESSGKYSKVCVGAQSQKDAKAIARRMQAKGFEAIVRRK